MNNTIRSNIEIGMLVEIVLKQNQKTGKLTLGTVDKILTNSSNHHHGIKVRLSDGSIGRVKNIIEENN